MMYYEDSYHPNADDTTSVVSGDTFYTLESKANSVKNKNKNIIEDAKRADKDYFSYHIKKNQKKARIEFYNSGVNIGNKIRDPITGVRTNHRIGSSDELMYFKARMNCIPTKTHITLFYDSPEQYERHHKCILPQNIKEKWYERKFQSKSYEYEPPEPITKTVVH